MIDRSFTFEQFRKSVIAECRATLLNFSLKIHQSTKNLLRTRRAAGNVDIDGDKPIDSLHHGVRVENPPRTGTCPHADTPFRLRHLKPDPLKHRHHFHRDAARDDHKIALSRTKPHDLRAETRDIEPARTRRH